MLRLLSPYAAVRYNDRYTERWIQFRSPESWQGRIRVRYRRVSFANLLPSGSLTHDEVKAYWREMLARAEPIPPLVASATPDGFYYLHDGNHRYCALADYFGEYGASLARVRVAVVEPVRGYRFAWRWFGEYGTYLLEAASQRKNRRLAPVSRPLIMGASEAHQPAEVILGYDRSSACSDESQLLVSAAAD